jgi:hypothetical protein
LGQGVGGAAATDTPGGCWFKAQPLAIALQGVAQQRKWLVKEMEALLLTQPCLVDAHTPQEKMKRAEGVAEQRKRLVKEMTALRQAMANQEGVVKELLEKVQHGKAPPELLQLDLPAGALAGATTSTFALVC